MGQKFKVNFAELPGEYDPNSGKNEIFYESPSDRYIPSSSPLIDNVFSSSGVAENEEELNGRGYLRRGWREGGRRGERGGGG